MPKTYVDKDAIKPVGCSKMRKFGGPVDLKISDVYDEVTDNAPMGLTADDLLGAIITVDDGDKETKYFANGVYEANNKVYFTLGSSAMYYDKASGRFKYVE